MPTEGLHIGSSGASPWWRLKIHLPDRLVPAKPPSLLVGTSRHLGEMTYDIIFFSFTDMNEPISTTTYLQIITIIGFGTLYLIQGIRETHLLTKQAQDRPPFSYDSDTQKLHWLIVVKIILTLIGTLGMWTMVVPFFIPDTIIVRYGFALGILILLLAHMILVRLSDNLKRNINS